MTALPFCELVGETMKERGLGLRELCRAADWDPSFLSKILSGKRSPPSQEAALRRLAQVLGLQAPELIASAGRIPSEWSRVLKDKDLFRSVHELACAGSIPMSPKRAQTYATDRQERHSSRASPVAEVEDLGEELL